MTLAILTDSSTSLVSSFWIISKWKPHWAALSHHQALDELLEHLSMPLPTYLTSIFLDEKCEECPVHKATPKSHSQTGYE